MVGKKSLVIVGSGSSLCGSGLGNFIDSQDAIVRFGGGETCVDGIERLSNDVGTRTTHLIQNFNLAALRRHTSRVEEKAEFYLNLEKVIFAHRGKHNIVANCIVLKNYNKFIQAGLDVEIVQIEDYVRQELENYSDWLRRAPEFDPHHTTAGFYAVLRALSGVNKLNYEIIYLCGFDALYKQDSRQLTKDPQHFYGSPFETEFGHDLFIESRIVLALKRHMNRIKILYTKEPYPEDGKIEIGTRQNGKFNIDVLSA